MEVFLEKLNYLCGLGEHHPDWMMFKVKNNWTWKKGLDYFQTVDWTEANIRYYANTIKEVSSFAPTSPVILNKDVAFVPEEGPRCVSIA